MIDFPKTISIPDVGRLAEAVRPLSVHVDQATAADMLTVTRLVVDAPSGLPEVLYRRELPIRIRDLARV